jgi:hypothetical protein
VRHDPHRARFAATKMARREKNHLIPNRKGRRQACAPQVQTVAHDANGGRITSAFTKAEEKRAHSKPSTAVTEAGAIAARSMASPRTTADLRADVINEMACERIKNLLYKGECDNGVAVPPSVQYRSTCIMCKDVEYGVVQIVDRDYDIRQQARKLAPWVVCQRWNKACATHSAAGGSARRVQCKSLTASKYWKS